MVHITPVRAASSEEQSVVLFCQWSLVVKGTQNSKPHSIRWFQELGINFTRQIADSVAITTVIMSGGPFPGGRQGNVRPSRPGFGCLLAPKRPRQLFESTAINIYFARTAPQTDLLRFTRLQEIERRYWESPSADSIPIHRAAASAAAVAARAAIGGRGNDAGPAAGNWGMPPPPPAPGGWGGIIQLKQRRTQTNEEV